MEEITEREKELLKRFKAVCGICEELDVYEDVMLDEILQNAKNWTQENYGK